MRVLAIMGSPKGKGNGYQVTRQIEAKMRTLGDVEFEYLFLKDANLGMCRGCMLCIVKGEDRCPLQDDRVRIEERIEASDGVILVSPGYVQNVSGLMKNFMDRLCYTHHRPRFFNQRVMIVANGGAGLDKTLAALRIALGGPRVVRELAVTKTVWPQAPKVEEKKKQAIERAALDFYRAVANKEPGAKPTFSEYMGFAFFKRMFPEMKDYLPADHAYYEDKQDYYYVTQVNPLYRVAGRYLVRFVLFMMRDMGPAKEARPMRP
jgi:multimeric flavodoxin WrbA